MAKSAKTEATTEAKTKEEAATKVTESVDSDVDNILAALASPDEKEVKEAIENAEKVLKKIGGEVKNLPKEVRPKAIGALRRLHAAIAKAKRQAEWSTAGGIAMKSLKGVGIAAGALVAAEGLGSMTSQNWMRPTSLFRDNERKRPIVQIKAIQFTPELGGKINNLIDEESERIRSERDEDDNVIRAADEFGRAKGA
jgi:ElaB/YqjD/DUF883 family membrane-anchored ribosome-binding protein